MSESYDVVVVGGGAAGLSGAIALARSRRSVLLFDAGDPRNAMSGHVHNFLTRDGVAPGDLYAAGRAELESYGGSVAFARVDSVAREGASFRVHAPGLSVTARRLLFATGTRDRLPDIPGLAQRWGTDVLHCPYCHGWEVRDQRIGVLATGPMAVHQTLLFRQLSQQVVLLDHAGPGFTPEQEEQLAALGVPRVAGVVVELTRDADGLTGVRLADGTTVGLDVVVVAPVSYARAELLAPLGIEPTEVLVGDVVVGTQVPVDPTGATSAPGVWAAGNLTSTHAQVMASAAAGLLAGAAINGDLVLEDAAQASHAGHAAPPHEPHEWDERYASVEQVWSGAPNGALVHEVGDLPPGRALDVGCGEGGDAVWLAERGWDVTALDVSSVALTRARTLAERLEASVTWLHSGLLDAPLEESSYDLVSAMYPALLRTAESEAERRLLSLVAPGGTLLVVHHAHIDAHQARSDGWDPNDYVMPTDVARLLGESWKVEVHEQRARHIEGGAGAHHSHDLVLRAHRLR